VKKIDIILTAFALMFFGSVSSQNPVISKTNENKGLQIPGTETPTEYSITNYKNVDYLKINPLQLEELGFHTDIYISNTLKGVIIISSAQVNDTLKDFRNTLELNPNYYESFTRQDTIIFSPGNTQSQVLDFTKASSIRHDYKNAFNYSADPRSGLSWSKGTHKDFSQDDAHGKVVYDLIIVLPKTLK
jgi:hypothetical protein